MSGIEKMKLGGRKITEVRWRVVRTAALPQLEQHIEIELIIGEVVLRGYRR
jgi:hypothetical protein